MLKNIVFAIAFLFALSALPIKAQTSLSTTSTRVQTTLVTPTPTPIPETNSLLSEPLITVATPTPVSTAAATTKGGLPVSGSAEVTILLALAGVALMSYGAFKAYRR
jgi:hypothetical protein